MVKTVYKPIFVGSKAPDFKANTTDGPLSLYEWLGDSWSILFSHPAAFTPVCTTELGVFARRKKEFDTRGVKLLGLSTSPLNDTRTWTSDIKEITGATVNYPIIADEELEISALYGMINSESTDTQTIRNVFFIDPNKVIRAYVAYPATTGRNVDEILRIIDSLQLRDSNSLATPVDWKPGDECLIPPTITDPKKLKELFPKGWKEIRSWFRPTPSP